MSFADFLAAAVAGDRGVKPIKEGQARTVYSLRSPRERSWPYTDDERPARRIKEF